MVVDRRSRPDGVRSRKSGDFGSGTLFISARMTSMLTGKMPNKKDRKTVIACVSVFVSVTGMSVGLQDHSQRRPVRPVFQYLDDQIRLAVPQRDEITAFATGPDNRIQVAVDVQPTHNTLDVQALRLRQIAVC